ncbi:polar amino acid transport system substrate-binding protein [Polaromonas sp. YR568]|nr:polar amino acid transport system substrate-binding protein [Polaromonas sp. YR568]
MNMPKLTLKSTLAGLAMGLASAALFAQAPPAPGASPRIDAIKKSGELRVAVLQNSPWLLENTTGSGQAWSGPAWTLANEYARLLNVKLVPVAVSHETKVPVLAANQVDMTISPLGETPERLKVVDFVIYSTTSVCMFGRAGNDKLAKVKSVDDLNSPDITIAYFTGGAEENWVKERFPKAKFRAVASSGATAPVEEIMAKRADAAPINRVPWVGLNQKVKGLTVFPQENNCQGSKEKASPVGLAVDKNQQVYLDWLRAVEKTLEPKLAAEEKRVIENLK